jgi:uncharacterized protein (DUF2062 family)
VARFWFRARRFLVLKILHADDSPHAIALGAGIATVIAFLPLIGLQTLIAISVAAVVRANKAICIPIVWITNPFTLVPIYGACLGLGHVVMAVPASHDPEVVLSELEKHNTTGLFEIEFWKGLLHRIAGLGTELWVGCIIVGLICGVVAYVVSRWGVSAYRERRRRALLRRGLLRPRPQAVQVTRQR